jgi:hypothetical protein
MVLKLGRFTGLTGTFFGGVLASGSMILVVGAILRIRDIGPIGARVSSRELHPRRRNPAERTTGTRHPEKDVLRSFAA